jgi:SAM-dependent methyltransferase
MIELTKPEEVTRQSYDRQAEAWMSGHWTAKFWGENFDKFFELLPKGRILEIGCGPGRDAQELIGHGYDYIGTDFAPGILKLAHKNNPRAKFLEKNLYDLNFKEPFDGFWCAAVLIHVPKARINEALKSIRRNLKPRAIGFIAMKEGIGERLESRSDINDANFLFSYWQNDDFKEVLASNDLEVLDEGYMPMSARTKLLTYIVRLKDDKPTA